MIDPTNGQAEYLPPSDEWRSLNEPGKAQTDEQKRALDSLKETLLTSLQMQNLVVLTGSGTSISVDGPSIKDLWDAAIGKIPTPDASKVAERINYDLKKPTQNIEEFLSRCEAFLQINDDNHMKMFVGACKKVILDKCSAFLDVKKLDGHKTFLHRLSR